MRTDTLHLTLAFLGSLPVAALQVAQATARATNGQRCGLQLDRLSYWAHNRILFAGATDCPFELRNLADDLRAGLRAAGLRVEARAFSVHVTLVRNARSPGPLLVPPVAVWPIKEFVLVRSTVGARYEVLERFSLAGD